MSTRATRSDRLVIVVAALLFAGSAAVTIAWCASMAGMGGMDMPGGWTMSMAWMRMPGQGWTRSAATFLGMWAVMMVAMMLPALTAAMRRRSASLAARVAAAYFGVWLLLGVVVYPLGLALAGLEMRHGTLAQRVPLLAALALVIAGWVQLTPWKSRQLDCCRSAALRPAATPRDAWRRGFTLGLRCSACCAPLTAALLVLGVMDVGAMAAATVAISLERLSARGAVVARITGALLIVAAGAALLRCAAA